MVIATYNCERYLSEALESIVRQTFVPDEIIVVDDGSTDETKAKVYRHSEKIRYIHQAHQGVSAARNRGLKLPSGRYVAIQDADDVSASNRFEKQITAMKNDSAAVACFTGYWTFSDEGRVKDYLGNPSAGTMDSLSHLGSCLVVGGSLLFDRYRARGLGYPVGVSSGEDIIFAATLRTRGRFVVIKDALYGYRSHSGQASRRHSETDNFEQRLNWAQQHWQEFWPEKSLAQVEEALWKGFAQTMASFYWARHRDKFLELREYIHANWPSHIPPPPERFWRWYPDWIWTCKSWLDQGLAKFRRVPASQGCER